MRPFRVKHLINKVKMQSKLSAKIQQGFDHITIKTKEIFHKWGLEPDSIIGFKSNPFVKELACCQYTFDVMAKKCLSVKKLF